jgi:peptide deformylase
MDLSRGPKIGIRFALGKKLMIRRILTIPRDRRILRSPCAEVTPLDDWASVLRDLEDTLRATPNAAGLAAPQIGSLLRIFVVRDGPRVLEFINPQIEGKGPMVTDWEGCLSMPGFSAVITRSEYVKVVPVVLGPAHIKPDFEATGHLARVIQHEYDHLLGILIGQREAMQVKAKQEARA